MIGERLDCEMRTCAEQSVLVPFSTLPDHGERRDPYPLFDIIHSRNSVLLAHGAVKEPPASKSSGNVPDLSAGVTFGCLPSPRILAKIYLCPSCHFKLTSAIYALSGFYSLSDHNGESED
jgi:hypothetical protein